MQVKEKLSKFEDLIFSYLIEQIEKEECQNTA